MGVVGSFCVDKSLCIIGHQNVTSIYWYSPLFGVIPPCTTSRSSESCGGGYQVVHVMLRGTC